MVFPRLPGLRPAVPVLLLCLAGPAQAQPVFLSGVSDCAPFSTALAPDVSGFSSVWFDEGDLDLRSWNRDAAARDRGTTLFLDVLVDPAIFSGGATSLLVTAEGDRIVAWASGHTSPPTAYALRIAASGDLVSRNLGQLDVTPDGIDLHSRLQSVGDGSFLLTFDHLTRALRFDFDELLETVDLGTDGNRTDLLLVGDEIWWAGSRELVTSPPSAAVFLERRELDGSLIQQVATDGNFGTVYGIRLARVGDAVLMAWTGGDGTLARRFDLAGAPLGDRITLSAPSGRTPHDLAVVSDPTGNALVVWGEADIPSPFFEQIVGRTLAADGAVSLAPQVLAAPEREGVVLNGLDAVGVGAGESWVTTSLYQPLPFGPVPCGLDHLGVTGHRARLSDRNALLLQEGRFRVRVAWSDPASGDDGVGAAVPGTELSGSFWFFDEDNKEIEIKIIDGRTVNGSWWVFAAGLSDVGYEIVVEDLVSGLERSYENAPKEFGNFIDTAAFPGDLP